MHWLELALLKSSSSKDISKKKKVIVIIDSGSTHNFIHYKLAKALNFTLLGIKVSVWPDVRRNTPRN